MAVRPTTTLCKSGGRPRQGDRLVVLLSIPSPLESPIMSKRPNCDREPQSKSQQSLVAALAKDTVTNT